MKSLEEVSKTGKEVEKLYRVYDYEEGRVRYVKTNPNASPLVMTRDSAWIAYYALQSVGIKAFMQEVAPTVVE